MIPFSLDLPLYGDKLNADFFEEYLAQRLENRDRSGLTSLIRQIDALMITVEPGHASFSKGGLMGMSPWVVPIQASETPP